MDFRPSEIVAGAIWGRNTRPYGRRTCWPPHLLRHARNRSSAWRGVLNYYASYFRSGVLYTPINNYTNDPSQGPPTRASTSYPSASGEAVLLCLQSSISSTLKNNWYCRLDGGFVRTTRSAKSKEATASSASMLATPLQ